MSEKLLTVCLLCWTGFSWGCGPGHLSPSDLTDTERSVQVFHAGQSPNCQAQDLGVVEATSGTAFSMGTYGATVAVLQREAAALGATAIVILDHSKNQMADQATARAIRCYAPLPAAYPPAQPGYAPYPPAQPGYAPYPPAQPGYAPYPPAQPGYAPYPPAQPGYAPYPPAQQRQDPPAPAGSEAAPAL